MTTQPGAAPPELSPLEMAENSASAVQRLANWTADQPMEATIGRAGERAQASARMAACMALVSIAGDLRRIADHLTRGEGT